MTRAASPAASGPTPGSASASGGPGHTRRGLLLFTGASLLLALLVLLGLSLFVGVEIDAPTLGLAAACVVLVWALRALWGVVVALARPQAESILVAAEAAEVDGALGGARADLAELREEKRRVLRAIKELEFDHAMGKLSDEDFKEIGDRYRLRAIEVIRELEPHDGRGELHPLLLEHLAAVGAAVGAAQPSAAQASAAGGQP